MTEHSMFGSMKQPPERTHLARNELAGVKHRHRMKPLQPRPGQAVRLFTTTMGPIPFDAVRCWLTTEDRASVEQSTQVLDFQVGRAVWSTLEWDYVQEWWCELPPQPAGTMLRYHIGAHVQGTDRWVFADSQASSIKNATPFALWIDHDAMPAWARQAIVYQIFVDRFFPGHGCSWQQPKSLSGFFGGTLQGVTDQLDYIQSLGFDTLWLSPVFASPSHHGYDSTDYYTVEPRLGTNADLKQLIHTCHQRSMRIVLDFVPNHWSHRHPTFVAAQRDADNPYRNWYRWKKWPSEYDTFLNVKTMPKLNLSYPPMRQYLLDCARHWLQQGVDGFRLDHANGPSHDFWADFRRVCRATKPDCWLFGEVVHTPATQRSYAPHLDGNLDFLLADALRSTFLLGRWTLARFESFLTQHESYFPEGFCQPAFLDNHDMTRALYLARGDRARLKLAALVLFTLRHPPIVYYGTEVGVSQNRPLGRFEEARLPMKWGAQQDQELRDYFGRLAQLRRSYPFLAETGRRTVHLAAPQGTYAYVRQAPEGTVLVALNASGAQRSVTFSAEGLPLDLRDQLTGHPLRRQGNQATVDLGPRQGAWFAG